MHVTIATATLDPQAPPEYRHVRTKRNPPHRVVGSKSLSSVADRVMRELTGRSLYQHSHSSGATRMPDGSLRPYICLSLPGGKRWETLWFTLIP